ncbi:hypothetical protein Tco_0418264 [Tanacetum coccineum]
MGFSVSATLMSSPKILTSSLEHFDVVTRKCDAVSMTFMPSCDQLLHNFVDVMEVEHDIENMTLDEYLQYESKRERYDYESSCEDDEEDTDSIEKVIDDLFRMGAENLKRMEKRKLKWKIVMRGNWNNFRILQLAVTHTYHTYFTQTRAGGTTACAIYSVT